MATEFRPLAEQLRPASIEEIVGQSHILGSDKPLASAIQNGKLHSMVLWGPPGTGKTTLARLFVNAVDADFIQLSAVLSGVKDIREAIAQAKSNRDLYKKQTVLFIDEVHRFNKSQQDSFLPYVEAGDVIFIGATTENPSFEVNNALLSRVRVYPLNRLSVEELQQIVERARRFLSGQNASLTIDSDSLEKLIGMADGDARRLLNLVDLAIQMQFTDSSQEKASYVINKDVIGKLLSGYTLQFDNKGDLFYDQISALHKSVRGSSPDAAVYWLTRMLEAGCDPLYIARRVVRMASEDIGNADPRALQISLNAWDTVHRLGKPEGDLALAQAVIYMACAAKSNAVYKAFNKARKDATEKGSLQVPLHLRNAPTNLMKDMNYGRDYRYAHDYENGYVAGENYFPDDMKPVKYYHPVNRGLEISITEKLRALSELDKQAEKENND